LHVDDVSYEEARATTMDKTTAPPVRVSSDGSCVWYPPGWFSTLCPVDISHFPFDNQTCELHFYSWMYSAPELDLTSSWPNVSGRTVESGEWNICKFRLWRSSSISFA